MILVFCGIAPTKIDMSSKEEIAGHLQTFTEDADLIHMIAKCLATEPACRPELLELIDFINKYRTRLATTIKQYGPEYRKDVPGSTKINSIINKSLFSFALTTSVTNNGIWSFDKVGLSKGHGVPNPVPLGLRNGITGPLYLVAKARQFKYDTTPCSNIYDINYKYLLSSLQTDTQFRKAGLIDGVVGIALAADAGNLAGYNNDNKFNALDYYLSERNSEPIDLASGLAGDGLTLIKCGNMFDAALLEKRIERIVDIILAKQERSGAWHLPLISNNRLATLSLYKGMAGILLFLISYWNHSKSNCALLSIQRGLEQLARQVRQVLKSSAWSFSNGKMPIDIISCSAGLPGIALTFIKAHELLNDSLSREMVEAIFEFLPEHVLSSDYSQLHGLSGLGEIYLEASRINGYERYEPRLHWISKVLVHTFIKEGNESGFWPDEHNDKLAMGLLTGFPGILHFLMRTQHPKMTSFFLNF